MTDLPNITASITAELGGIAVKFGIKPGRLGKICKRKYLKQADLPGDFCEARSLRRSDGGAIADLRETVSLVQAGVRTLCQLAQGRPVLWICSREHASMYRRLLARDGYRVEVLRGSLREGNPYPPLSVPGWSDDEHVLMVTKS